MSARSSLVYDLANTQGMNDPEIFVKRSWLSLNDDLQSYNSSQSRISTSSISAAKFVNFSTAYLDVPLMLNIHGNLSPATAASSADFALGLKNAYQSCVHSLSISINGNSVVNTVPHIGIFNNFRLMQNLSVNELKHLSHIGFYPPNRKSFVYQTAASVDGIGSCYNRNSGGFDVVDGTHSSLGTYNDGYLNRQLAISYNESGLSAPSAAAFSTLLTKTACATLYKSHVFNTVNNSSNGIWQCAVNAQIRLKDLHSLFAQLPLLRGVFLELTINWNQTSHTISVNGSGAMTCTDATTNSPLGGISPLLFASKATGNGNASTLTNSSDYVISVNVGNKVLNNTIAANPNQVNSPLAQSVSLHIESMTMSPNWEAQYLKNPVKEVSFEDVYSYQVKNVASSATFDQLLSAGVSNLKSIVILPFYTNTANGSLTPIYSPFSEEGASGGGSPLALLSNVNVRVAGENIRSDTAKYNYQSFIEELYGERNLNGSLTDGLASGLVGKDDWELAPAYYFNLSHMPAQDITIPKSISIVGQNVSAKAIDLFVFITFKRTIKIDCLTGLLVQD